MHKKYIVRLSDGERVVCQDVVQRLKGTSEKVKRAQMLLKADADGPAWIDARIAEAFDCRVQTVESLRKRLVTQGFEQALERKRRETSPTPRKLDGVAEAKLIAMRLGKPPAGYGRWSLQLLADELVVLEVVIADKGYDSQAVVAAIEAQGAEAVVPSRSNAKSPRKTDWSRYKDRNLVERFWSKLKHYRRVATRYEKKAQNFLAFVHLASLMILLQ